MSLESFVAYASALAFLVGAFFVPTLEESLICTGVAAVLFICSMVLDVLDKTQKLIKELQAEQLIRIPLRDENASYA